eukprot:1158893-Pelagomonas_calceolata.AAC.18
MRSHAQACLTKGLTNKQNNAALPGMEANPSSHGVQQAQGHIDVQLRALICVQGGAKAHIDSASRATKVPLAYHDSSRTAHTTQKTLQAKHRGASLGSSSVLPPESKLSK